MRNDDKQLYTQNGSQKMHHVNDVCSLSERLIDRELK